MPKRKWSDQEIELYRKEHGAFFYFNKDDANIIVPKAYGFLSTVNWANPIPWMYIITVLAIILWSVNQSK